jgi:hypothetical protein
MKKAWKAAYVKYKQVLINTNLKDIIGEELWSSCEK